MSRKNILIFCVLGVALLVSGALIINMENEQNKQPNIANIRDVTQEELEYHKRRVEVIGTKYGDFRYTANEDDLPSEGIVYDIDDVNKNTKMIIIDNRKFIKEVK